VSVVLFRYGNHEIQCIFMSEGLLQIRNYQYVIFTYFQFHRSPWLVYLALALSSQSLLRRCRLDRLKSASHHCLAEHTRELPQPAVLCIALCKNSSGSQLRRSTTTGRFFLTYSYASSIEYFRNFIR